MIVLLFLPDVHAFLAAMMLFVEFCDTGTEQTPSPMPLHGLQATSFSAFDRPSVASAVQPTSSTVAAVCHSRSPMPGTVVDQSNDYGSTLQTRTITVLYSTVEYPYPNTHQWCIRPSKRESNFLRPSGGTCGRGLGKSPTVIVVVWPSGSLLRKENVVLGRGRLSSMVMSTI